MQFACEKNMSFELGAEFYGLNCVALPTPPNLYEDLSPSVLVYGDRAFER